MKKPLHWLAFAACFVLFIVGLRVVYSWVVDRVRPVVPMVEQAEEEKTPAPDFQVMDEEGNMVSLSDFAGRPVIINCWASWCPPCRNEMPYFEAVFRELEADGTIAFLMIDMVGSNGETIQKGASFIAEQGYTFPVYYDTEGQVASLYGISALPTTVLVDEQGTVVSYTRGGIVEQQLRYGVALLLGEETAG